MACSAVQTDIIAQSTRQENLRSEIHAWEWQNDGSRAAWDGLRRDRKLWSFAGDCLVYLYDEGQSQRGPSFRIPYQLLVDANCSTLIDLAIPESYDTADTTAIRKTLFLGAPSYLPREDAFKWHVTTRNFFAWLLGQPLVGRCLSRAMIDLLRRMEIYREASASNVSDLLEYADEIGYSNISGRPDLALAMLSFADEFKITDPWVDAFAHCVGMNEYLCRSQEYEFITPINKALITRAALQMELRLGLDIRAVEDLVAEDLSSLYVDIPSVSRPHMELFRSFLRSYLKTSCGSWPCQQGVFSKSFYTSLRAEFEKLYHHLADLEEAQSDVSVTSGLFAKHIVKCPDTRYTFLSLPYSFPLLPDINTGSSDCTQGHWATRNWKISSKNYAQTLSDLVRSAYYEATCRSKDEITKSPLVQAYAYFESELAEGYDAKLISFSDARKSRWIVVYQMLQRFISLTQAPVEVRDKESAAYPLCCSTEDLPPWSSDDVTHDVCHMDVIFDRPSAPAPEKRAPRQLPRAYYEQHHSSSSSLSSKGAVGAPLIPAKSNKRWSEQPTPSSQFDALRPVLTIPERSSSKRSKHTSINSSTSSSSMESAPSMTRSVSSSDTVPSLSWNQDSPASESALPSDDEHSNSPLMSSSSSIYSTDDVPLQMPSPTPAPLDIVKILSMPLPPHLQPAEEKNQQQTTTEEPFVNGEPLLELFAGDGVFVVPGIAF